MIKCKSLSYKAFFISVSIEAVFALLVNSNIGAMTLMVLLIFPTFDITRRIIRKNNRTEETCFGWKIGLSALTGGVVYLLGTHFFKIWICSGKVAYIASLIGITSAVLLLILAVVGAIIAVPAVYTLLEYVLLTIKKHNRYQLSQMLNLFVALFYVVGVLMRTSPLCIKDLLYFSHSGGVLGTIVSIKYAAFGYKNQQNRTACRYTATVVWALIFLYVLFVHYLFGRYSTKYYLFSAQTFYHVIAPLLSMGSYIFFENHISSWKICLFPVMFTAGYSIFHVVYPIAFKTEPMYSLADISIYGVGGILVNLVVIIMGAFVVSILFLCVSKVRDRE